jgi:hypothetical protein
MSQNYDRLKISERNRIIENYRNGTPDPNYDVIPNKTQEGKYTIRKKVQQENQEKTQEVHDNGEIQQEGPVEQPQQQEEDYNPFNDEELYYPQNKLSKQQIFTQMQLMMNQMFIENFKALRVQQKHTEKKRKMVGQKAKKIHDILVNVVKDDPDEEEPEQIQIQKEPELKNTEPEQYEVELNQLTQPKQQSRRDRLKNFI